jgi:hypothetical protein
MLFSALKVFFCDLFCLQHLNLRMLILWTGMQVDEDMKKAARITDQQYINQFPFEACLVMKHHLAETIRKVRKANSLCM